MGPTWSSGASSVGRQRNTLVLDMDETLLHSSFQPTPADFVVPICTSGQSYSVYVRKRPYVEYFLRKACEMFEVVIWTASIQDYAEPIIDKLVALAGGQTAGIKRMYRTSCTTVSGQFIKDLSTMGVPLDNVCIVDNSPAVAVLQPQNYIPISSWFRDAGDAALLDLLPLLERLGEASTPLDVLAVSQIAHTPAKQQMIAQQIEA